MALLPQPGNCCTPCTDPEVQNIPGSQGQKGDPGTNGTNGHDAYTTITATWVMPAEGATVNLPVVSSAWATIGLIVFIQNGGYFQVSGIPDAMHVTVRNLANTASGLYVTNAPPGTNEPSSLPMTSGGLQGPTGASSTATLNSLSPTMAKGDILVDNGANAPSASLVRKAVGANKRVLTAKSSDATGVNWDLVDLTASVTGVLPIANGGTGQTKPAAMNGSFKNLLVANIPTFTYISRTQVGVTADAIILKTSGGDALVAEGINLTPATTPIDATNPIGQPLGLDTGTFNSSTFYYIWLISDGTSVSAVLSASHTAPTLTSPSLSTYTYKALVGFVYSDGSSHFRRMLQVGSRMCFEEQVALNAVDGKTTFQTTDIDTIIPIITYGFFGTVGVDSAYGTAADEWGMVLATDSETALLPVKLGWQAYAMSTSGSVALNGFLNCSGFYLPINDTNNSGKKQLVWKTSNTKTAQYRLTITGCDILI